MKSSKRWFLLAVVLATFNNISAAGPFKKVSIASSTKSITSAAAAAASTTTTTTTSTTPIPEEATSDEGDEKSDNNNSTGHLKNSKLTGIPQIDYIWDPNLPRELRGYNLSSYPFFATVPPEEDIHFKCDGLHDGFYASIEHKCQVYHHCVYGIRHDFLCANFTAFDQKTFICHFVSDVDCEGSQKYWNRNDDLYMATTTTSTTTTTTEPPPTPKRRPVRPLRPLRRPVNRRPIDDYYYDEEEYDEDYYEERLNRRRKQRPRHRKPMVDYEDDYLEDEKHTADLRPRRPNSRDRFRDDPDIEIDDDYETERRKIDRTKPRNKPVATAERRKISNRKPGSLVGRANADERRSLSEDRPLTSRKKSQTALTDEFTEPVESPPRRLAGRKRVNDRRPPPTPSTATDFDDLDEYEKPHAHAFDQDADAAEEDVAPKLKTTTKPLEEFITPKAAPSSVYARPRAPPRIARPVPINEKKKFQYPVQKTATTVRPPLASSQDDEPDYYEDEDYVDVPAQRGHSRRRIVDDVPIEEDELPLARRRNQKPTRTLRKPTIEPKKSTTVADEEDYGVEERYVSRGVNRRRNGYLGRTRNRAGANDDVDFFDDEYDERPARRSRPNGRKGAKKPRIPEPSEEVDEEEFESELEQKPLRSRPSTVSTGRRKNAPSLQSRSRSPTPPPVTSDESESGQVEDADPPTASGKNQATINRPASVHIRRRTIISPPQAQSRNGYGSRMTSISQQQQKHQHYYDEYEY
uniref:Chitin-binding type-2 domain-containing protein n=1 Tax=Glossina brevipalpis TaxID=37001 RepID=A0A1A9X0H1_9MUSC